MASYLTLEDERNFGPELLDVATRAARHALAPELQRLHNETQALQEQLGEQAHKNLEQALDRLVPNWRAINADERFHQWLGGIHEPSGRLRQELLNNAAASNDARRLSMFFREFLAAANQATATRASQRNPRRTRARTTASGERIYDRSEITRMWERRRQGRINDADWARWEAELCRASAEGRIAGGLDQDGIPVSR